MLKIFDLFAGVGSFRLGSSIFNKHRINYKFVGWSEVDKYCRYLINQTLMLLMIFHR